MCSDVIKGELDIIHEEIENFISLDYTANLNVADFLESVKSHLFLIEQKIGTNSIEYINITTEIVDVISNRLLDYTNFASSDNVIEKLSASDIVKYYANQRKNLIEAFKICRRIESMNMDYAYRIRTFNKTKEKIEKRCREKGIDSRTSIQKNVDQLKSVASFTGAVAKETTGCAINLALQIIILIIVFLVLMAIVGVK